MSFVKRLNGLLRMRIGFRPQNIRFRLTLFLVAVLMSVMGLFSVLLYQDFLRTHEKEFNTALYNRAVDVSQAIDIGFFGNLSIDEEMLAPEKIFPFSLGKSITQILRSDGTIVARQHVFQRVKLPNDPALLLEVRREGHAFRTLDGSEIFGQKAEREDSESKYRMVSYLVRRDAPVQLIVQIAVPMTLLSKEKEGLISFFLISIPLALVLAAFGGYTLSGRALRPLFNMIVKAASISATNLNERLPVPRTKDELRTLAITMNDLLNRLQQAFEGQERFVADASHQLRTPLAILRGELDLMMSRPRTPEEIQEFVQSAAQELGHLSRMVDDLLLLARVDAGTGSLDKKETRMDEVALDAMSRLEPLAQGKMIRTCFNLVGTEFEVSGDADLLRTMLQNLIENAIKFSPEGERVEVRVESSPEAVDVEVRNRGPKIPDNALPNIFERFFRAQDQEAKTPGVGLGLAVSKRIIEAHGGSIQASSSEQDGTRARVAIKKL